MILPVRRKKPVARKGKVTAVGLVKNFRNKTVSPNWDFYRRRIIHSKRRGLIEKVHIDALSGKTDSGRVQILGRNDKVIGTASFRRVLNWGRVHFLIEDVDVSAGYKREGFLNQMLSEISFIAEKNKVKRLELAVDSNNTVAILAYMRFGFKKQRGQTGKNETKNETYYLVKILDSKKEY